MKNLIHLSDAAYTHNLRPMLKRIELERAVEERQRIDDRKAKQRSRYVERKLANAAANRASDATRASEPDFSDLA